MDGALSNSPRQVTDRSPLIRAHAASLQPGTAASNPRACLPGSHQADRDADDGPVSRKIGLSKRELRARAKKIAEGNWASAAVRKAIEEMMAAVLTATTAATIATTASAG